MSGDDAALVDLGLARAQGHVSVQLVIYQDGYRPPTLECERIVCVPHGRTPSNARLLFQSHKETPIGELLPESFAEAVAGAHEFFTSYGARLVSQPDDFRFLCSPLKRTKDTAGVYQKVARDLYGIELSIFVDPEIIEINHASWDNKTVQDLQGEDAELAAAYREGSFFAKPASPGESKLDLLRRCKAWLTCASEQYAGKVLVVFGHGTFQNSIETILQPPYVKPDPVAIFSRKPGASHLRRGFPHDVYTSKDL